VFFLPAIASDFRFGISGGVNLGELKTDWKYIEEPDVFPRFGYTFGLGSEIRIQKHISLLADLNLVSKNYAYDPVYYGYGTEGFDRYSFLYLDLPLRLSYIH
jgi:hypothetical protein